MKTKRVRRLLVVTTGLALLVSVGCQPATTTGSPADGKGVGEMTNVATPLTLTANRLSD
jgi:hypothetical protein